MTGFTLLIHLISVVALGAAVWVALSALRMKREIDRARSNLKWIEEEAQRAVRQLNSNDRDRVIAGLQTLGALNVREVRLEALHKIVDLAKSQDPTVAKHANSTLDRVLPAVREASRHSAPPPEETSRRRRTRVAPLDQTSRRAH